MTTGSVRRLQAVASVCIGAHSRERRCSSWMRCVGCYNARKPPPASPSSFVVRVVHDDRDEARPTLRMRRCPVAGIDVRLRGRHRCDRSGVDSDFLVRAGSTAVRGGPDVLLQAAGRQNESVSLRGPLVGKRMSATAYSCRGQTCQRDCKWRQTRTHNLLRGAQSRTCASSRPGTACRSCRSGLRAEVAGTSLSAAVRMPKLTIGASLLTFERENSVADLTCWHRELRE